MQSVRLSNARARAARQIAARGGLDRQRLDGVIADLRAATPTDDRTFRQKAVERIGAALNEGRAEAQEELEHGGLGRPCAARLSELEDEIICATHDMAARLLH